MVEFRFHYPIEIRYGDLDPQGHVNNAQYLTYFEQARIAYIKHLELWDGCNFSDIGIILADAHLTFHAPVTFNRRIQVAVCVSRLGKKSLTMEYRLIDIQRGEKLASGSTILVTYDYRDERTIPIPANWRQAINAFEGLPETA